MNTAESNYEVPFDGPSAGPPTGPTLGAQTKKFMTNMEDDIVITGIGGRYPEADDVNEFWGKLVSGQELVTIDDRRWPVGFLGLPERHGKVKNVSKFDNEFFNLTDHEGNFMDAQVRLLLETTYEAIWDAGIDPASLRGTNTAVYAGMCYDDTGSALRMDEALSAQYCSFSVQRVAYCFDFKGPSLVADTACASSFSAFCNAFIALKTGLCDQAIVCGAAIHLCPGIALAFHNLRMLSDDGRSKCLDANADGYARSESVIAIFLQKKSEAKRVYATIINSKTNNDGFKPEGITFPSMIAQKNLMTETYAEVGIDPNDIKYMEAHMTGTPAGDPVESEAIYKALCENRTEPLLMGCLKSNMGHTEGASGMCAISKACLAFERRELPPNLHLQTPNPSIEGLSSGLLKPVTERMKFDVDLIGVNSFGFGGCNVHTILRAHDKEPSVGSGDIFDPIPRLVQVCGRTPESVDYIIDYIDNNRAIITKDFLALLNDSMKTDPKDGMKYRGFMTFDQDKISQRQVDKIEYKKPMWFVFSALDSQWLSVGKALMPIQFFADSIQKSCQFLKSLQLDLLTLILSSNEMTVSSQAETMVETMVAIVSIQIALVDLFFALNLRPDGIVGYSLGEIVCGYADGCLTSEETLLVAYNISKICHNMQKRRGVMATIGLSKEESEKRCPEGVEVASDDSEESVTVSGYEAEVRMFLNQLTSEGVFVREVDSCSIPLHSKCVQNTYQPIADALAKVLVKPKLRSSKWLSTSIPSERWHEDEFRHLGPTYYSNNITSRVLLKEVLNYIPKNAVLVEFAPHPTLIPLLKRGLGPDVNCVPIMSKDNIVEDILSAFGHIYMNGINGCIEKLYPRVEYPVPRGTPSLSPLLKWNHSKDSLVTRFPEYFSTLGKAMGYEIDLMHPSLQYIGGHMIDGRILFPTTGFLWVVWEQMVLQKGGRDYSKYPIEFRNIRLLRPVLLSKIGQNKLQVKIIEESGEFCIIEGGHVCVTGYAKIPKNPSTSDLEKLVYPDEDPDVLLMQPKDIYKEFRVRGYDYGPTFQGLLEAHSDGSRGRVKWLGNWVSFTDSMLQLAILGQPFRGLYLPTYIEYIKCDPVTLFSNLEASKNEMGDSVVDIAYDKNIAVGASKGLIVKGLKATAIPRRQGTQIATKESYNFAPYSDVVNLPESSAKSLKEYTDLCEAMMSNIFEEGAEPEEEALRPFVASKDNNYSLLRLLYRVAKGDEALEPEKKVNESNGVDEDEKSGGDDKEKKEKEKVEEHKKSEKADIKAEGEHEEMSCSQKLEEKLKEYQNDLSYDMVTSVQLSNELLIRSNLDILVENAVSKKLKVIEVNTTSSLLFEATTAFLDSAILACTEYSVLHPSPAVITEAAAGAKVVEWTSSALPTDFKDIDLMIYKDFTSGFLVGDDVTRDVDLQKFLASSFKSLKDNAFMLLVFRSKVSKVESMLTSVRKLTDPKLRDANEMREATERAGFSVISEKFDDISFHTLFVRKPVQSVDDEEEQEPVVIHVVSQEYQWVNELKQQLIDIKEGESNEKTEKTDKKRKQNVWLVSEENPSGLVGLVNCLRREPNCGERVRCYFSLDMQSNSIKNIPQDLLKKDLVMNVCDKEVHGSFRHSFINRGEEMRDTEHAYLDIKTRGDMSSFTWYEADHKYWPSLPASARGEKQTLCHVYYSSLNFKDVMVASGKIPLDAYPAGMGLTGGLIGMEFSGRDMNGNRVMGFTVSKAIATTLLIHDPHFLFDVPLDWSLEQAASIPVVYLTVYYALFIRGNLQKGETVLIHAGSGGVGQAAIHICQALGCEVYTTCGSQEKRDFLKKQFGLKDNQIANSRDTTFEEHILKETNGNGVDLVLNSLSEEKLKASVRCLAEYGRFVEIGKYDLVLNNPMDMSLFGGNRTLNVACLAHLDYDAIVNKTESAIQINDKIRKMLEDGIKNGDVKPLSTHVFKRDEAEEAFRFMASGKHIGKVLIKIRDEEEVGSGLPPTPMMINAVRQTFFHPLKSYIVTGGLGGFGLELALWIISRGAKKLILTSRTGPKDSYQKLSLRRFKDIKAEVIVSTADVSTSEGTAQLFDEAEKLGSVGGLFNLSMVLKDAVLENQSPESFHEACLSKVLGTINLDKMTRKSHPDMEYFVCFSSVVAGRGNGGQTNYGFANSVMERICEARKRDGFPGLAIQWGAIGDVGVVAESLGGNDIIIGGTVPQRMPSCMETLDHFLQSPFTVCSSIVTADNRKLLGAGKGDLVRAVCHILGIKDHTTVDPNATLGDLGMDSLMAVEIKQGLEREYEVVMSTQEIRNLTIKDLKEIERKKKEGKLDSLKKKDLLSDAVTPEEILHMGKANFVKLNEVQQGKPLFFFPGIEGSFRTLRPLAKFVSRPMVGINWTEEADKFGTIKDIVKYYVHLIRQNYPDSQYDFVGYDMGALFALETTAQLQKDFGDPTVKKMLLLDSAPDPLKANAAHLLAKNSNENEFHAELLLEYLSIFFALENREQLKQSLIQLKSKEDRNKLMAEFVAKEVNEECDPTLLGKAIERFYRKTKMVNAYDHSKKFTGELKLIRATERLNKTSQVDVGSDLGLCKLMTGGRFDLVSLEGNHRSLLTSHTEEIGSSIDHYFFNLLFA